jgi:hypothetical protein
MTVKRPVPNVPYENTLDTAFRQNRLNYYVPGRVPIVVPIPETNETTQPTLPYSEHPTFSDTLSRPKNYCPTGVI